MYNIVVAHERGVIRIKNLGLRMHEKRGNLPGGENYSPFYLVKNHYRVITTLVIAYNLWALGQLIWNKEEEQRNLPGILYNAISHINVLLILIICRDVGNRCVVRNTFYNKELRIVSKKRSWNNELKFGTRMEARGLSETVSVLMLLVVAVPLVFVPSYYATQHHNAQCSVESAMTQ
jgi:hypothetical protein